MPIRGYLFLMMVLLGSLFALTGLRQFFIDPIPNPTTNAIWFVMQVLPILLLTPILLKPSRNGFVYVALVAQLYFIHGVLLCFSELVPWGYAEILFALVLTAVASFGAKKLGAE